MGIGREGGMRRPGINALPRVNQIASGTCYIALSGGFSEQPRASTRDAHTRFHPSHQSSVLSNECFTSDYLERV